MSTRSIVSVKKIIPKVCDDTPTIRVTLDLSKNDAADILAMCNKIGGDPKYTARHVFDQLSTLLCNRVHPRDDGLIDFESIHFKPQIKKKKRNETEIRHRR
jgi:hypothetical protein